MVEGNSQVVFGGFGTERWRIGLLFLDLSRLELGNEVFDCLVLEVGADVAGEGSVCMALIGTAVKQNNTR